MLGASKARENIVSRCVNSLKALGLQLMRLSRALKENRPLYEQRHDKVISLYDELVQTYLEMVQWEVLPHPLYSPHIAASDYYLFQSMVHGLSEQRFHSFEEIEKWVDS